MASRTKALCAGCVLLVLSLLAPHLGGNFAPVFGQAIDSSRIHDEVFCAHSLPGADYPTAFTGGHDWFAAGGVATFPSPREPLAGSHRALIIFVRFSDDSIDSESGIWPQWRTTDTFPAFGSYFLVPAASDGQAPAPPYPEDSLTDYFYQQSNQQWLLYGEAYPEVIATDHPQATYGIAGTATSGLRVLTIEVLDKLHERGWDFSRYDADGDGIVDHIFLVLRQLHNVNWGGYSLLGSGSELEYDGVRVVMRSSGSYIRTNFGGNSMAQLSMGRLMAHEYGHDLWGRFFNHLSGIAANDVPSNHTRFLGYTLMAGGIYVSGEGDVNTDKAGNETISAFERDLLGWIDCRVLTESRRDLVVGSLYTTGDCYRFELVNRGTVYISNLQRTNFFDQLYSFPSSRVPHEDGLMSTGLMVGLNRGRDYDELPADNTIEIGIWSSTYEGDLYSPRTAVQVTPWTRPNINGYTYYRPGYNVSWQAVDNIRWGPGMSLRFDFVADVRTHPVIRKDSWMGVETSGHVFERPIVVMRGAELVITSGTTIHLADRVDLVVETDAVLTVEPGATIEMGRDGRLEAEGLVNADLRGWPTIRGMGD